jgi:hypothetical protein
MVTLRGAAGRNRCPSQLLKISVFLEQNLTECRARPECGECDVCQNTALKNEPDGSWWQSVNRNSHEFGWDNKKQPLCM